MADNQESPEMTSISVLGIALAALIKTLHDNKVIDVSGLTSEMTEAGISIFLRGKEQEAEALSKYTKALRILCGQET